MGKCGTRTGDNDKSFDKSTKPILALLDKEPSAQVTLELLKGDNS